MAVYPTMSVVHLDEVMLVVCPVPRFARADMDAVMRDCWADPRKKVIVDARDVELTAADRVAIAKFVKHNDVRCAVMLTSPLVRGMVTAMSWLTGGESFRSFVTGEFVPALTWLGVAPARHAEVRAMFIETEQRMRALLGGAASLRG